MKKYIVPLAMAFAIAGFAPAFAGPGSDSAQATEATPPAGPSDEKKEESTTPASPSTTPADPSTTKPEDGAPKPEYL